MKHFNELSEKEILALAITLEEEDARIYQEVGQKLQKDYPDSAKIFFEMAKEENTHRNMLADLYAKEWNEQIPFVRRQDVGGFLKRRPFWMMEPLKIETVREQVEIMELESKRFYQKAAEQCRTKAICDLLKRLVEAEDEHENKAIHLKTEHITETVYQEEARTEKRIFLLQVVQPGLAGLMDGSVSTLAPLFAAAFATQSSERAFLVGIAAAIGSGISMGFAETLSDNGSITGRGKPAIRGIICGVMTTIGWLWHTLPYLIPNFTVATVIAFAVVVVELLAIAFIQHKYMESLWWHAILQVCLWWVLVFLTGILIGSAG